MAQIKIDASVLEDYQKTAVKWQPTLLDLPIRAAMDVLKFMHGITGLRGKMKLGEISADSQFAPFKKTRKSDADVNISYREIETFLGNVVEEFAPVDYAFLSMGYDDPILGEKIKNASTTALVLFHLAKARGQHIAQAVLTGIRNEDGDTTLDLCDGLVTIAKKEITAGKISADNGNYIKLTDAFTMSNACDLIKEEVVFKLNPFLRRENNVLLCDPSSAFPKWPVRNILSSLRRITCGGLSTTRATSPLSTSCAKTTTRSLRLPTCSSAPSSARSTSAVSASSRQRPPQTPNP